MNQLIINRPPRPPTPDELIWLAFGFSADELIRRILDGRITVPSASTEKENARHSAPASNR